jgi:hypothetical protein
MGTHMRISYFIIFITLSAFGQTRPTIEVLKDPKTVEDYEHQFRGCLENSECDQVMGLQLSRWNELIKKVKDNKIKPQEKAQYLELFRQKYGIPVEFYTYQKSQQGFKPLLFNSSCKDHNPKQGEKVLRGISFLKSLSKEKALVWRDQTQIEVPTGDLLVPQPVFVYTGDKREEYLLPLSDQPLFIKDDELYVLREEDDFFYFLKITRNGDWKIEYIDMEKLSDWETRRSEVPCPKDPTKLSPKLFGVEFCKSVWNEDLKKTVIVKMHLGCVI